MCVCVRVGERVRERAWEWRMSTLVHPRPFPAFPLLGGKLVTATPLVPNHLSRPRELRVLKISPRHSTSVSCMFIIEARDCRAAETGKQTASDGIQEVLRD